MNVANSEMRIIKFHATRNSKFRESCSDCTFLNFTFPLLLTTQSLILHILQWHCVGNTSEGCNLFCHTWNPFHIDVSRCSNRARLSHKRDLHHRDINLNLAEAFTWESPGNFFFFWLSSLFPGRKRFVKVLKFLTDTMSKGWFQNVNVG